jgi:hypothetical protein
LGLIQKCLYKPELALADDAALIRPALAGCGHAPALNVAGQIETVGRFLAGG